MSSIPGRHRRTPDERTAPAARRCRAARPERGAGPRRRVVAVPHQQPHHRARRSRHGRPADPERRRDRPDGPAAAGLPVARRGPGGRRAGPRQDRGRVDRRAGAALRLHRQRLDRPGGEGPGCRGGHGPVRGPARPGGGPGPGRGVPPSRSAPPRGALPGTPHQARAARLRAAPPPAPADLAAVGVARGDAGGAGHLADPGRGRRSLRHPAGGGTRHRDPHGTGDHPDQAAGAQRDRHL